MAWMTIAQIKTRFPLWESLLADFDEPDDVLQQCADDAKAHLENYAEFEDELTDGQTLDYMIAVKKYIWDQKHDGVNFKSDERPQILKDWDDLDKRLKTGLVGSGNIRITAKTRDFAPEE